MTRRLLAFGVDWLLVDLAVWSILEMTDTHYKIGDGPRRFAGGYVWEVAFWLSFWVAYSGFFEGQRRMTLGKWIFGLRSAEGSVWLRAISVGLLMQSAALMTMAIMLLYCHGECNSWSDLWEAHPVLWVMTSACWPLGWIAAAVMVGWHSVRRDMAEKKAD